jgi:predicted  nucleic acid-binding Zn-ribbon protein
MADTANQHEVQVELQRLQSTSDRLAEQLESERLKFTELENETIKLRGSESELTNKCSRLEGELDAIRAQALRDNGLPSKDELLQDTGKLREQLQRAEERIALSASRLLQAEERAKAQEDRAAEFKVRV